ncbi:MAG: nucleotide 5'-monophosphate nucleosidase PpnN [Myxococcota bacterium]|nr:nucleotide 5'-monophosphate nucleosidase PpnN [Myxococcota bacterium]
MTTPKTHDRTSEANRETLDFIQVTPENTSLEALSPSEIAALFSESQNQIHVLLKRCVLAVLNSGHENDDVKTMLEKYSDFDVEVIRSAGGIALNLKAAPKQAFVVYEYLEPTGPVYRYKIIDGIRQNIFSVLRDLVFIKTEVERSGKYDVTSPTGITDAVFLILRNAGIFRKTGRHKIIVCWGGHAISREEYEYTKRVGYECGLRFMDVITGCGPGAMKGPMKGATIAHSKQRYCEGRYVGITEPGIIASEAPNPIVDPLVIMPDIEKRLEAFIRLGHGIVIFPGGAGTAEELMYLLGVLSHRKNRDVPIPVILTGPASSAPYFKRLNAFVRNTLGQEVASRYQIIIDDPARVAQVMNRGLLKVKAARERLSDSYYFNRSLYIPPIFQEPFTPSHDSVDGLVVEPAAEPYLYAATVRRVFSAVVWGNVKPEGISAIAERGPLAIQGSRRAMDEIDGLIQSFIEQGRMRLVGKYAPVYKML